MLAHHGLFWDFLPRALSEQMAARLRTALGAELTVAGYHLPLDAHPEIGNNALLCSRLGFERRPEPFAEVRGSAVGVIGRRDEPIASTELFAAVGELVGGRQPLVFDAGPAAIRRVAVVSGAAAQDVLPAADAGAECFVTGEPREPAMAQAQEAGIHFVAAGHYATEVFGVRAVGELLAGRFGVDHVFIDVPNPI